MTIPDPDSCIEDLRRRVSALEERQSDGPRIVRHVPTNAREAVEDAIRSLELASDVEPDVVLRDGVMARAVLRALEVLRFAIDEEGGP